MRLHPLGEFFEAEPLSVKPPHPQAADQPRACLHPPLTLSQALTEIFATCGYRVKELSSRWTLVTLLVPLVLIGALALLPLGCGKSSSSSTAAPATAKGSVQVGFVNDPSSDFQQVLLNVIEVKINPSTDLTLNSNSSSFATIPAPSGVGKNSFNSPSPINTNQFTGSLFSFGLNARVPSQIGTGFSELQVDLDAHGGMAQLFNASPVRSDTYQQVLIKLDPTTPLYVVPRCGNPPVLEGCVPYPATLADNTTLIRALGNVVVGPAGLTPLVMQVTVSATATPSAPGGSFTVSPTLTVVSNQGPSPPTNPTLGLVTGTVNGAPAKGETVTAELADTDNVIAIAAVFSDGSYSVQLPAGPGGTLYDLYASGEGFTYDAVQDVLVMPGVQTTQNFTVSKSTFQTITGKISNACANAAVVPVNLDLLVPAEGAAVNCGQEPILGKPCVVVATATTDEVGNYPMAGQFDAPGPFKTVPPGSGYGLRVKSSGFDPLLSAVSFGATEPSCSASSGGSGCDFSLASSTLTGTVELSAPVPGLGPAVEVLIMAEDTGTNDIESFGIATVRPGESTAAFTFDVPTSATAKNGFDLFASAQDLFLGSAVQNTAHSFAVKSGVASGAQCETINVATPLGPITCVGRASATGSVSPPVDDGTEVRLIKTGVQIMRSQVGLPGTPMADQYAFCAPADTYQVELSQDNVLVPPASAPFPMATPVPQPGTCNPVCGPNTTTCLLCTGKTGPSVP